MDWVLWSGAIFGALLVLLAIGLPVAFSLGLVGLIGIFFLLGSQSLGALPSLAWNYANNPMFIALPLFVFMAEVMACSGIGADIFATGHKWLGRIPGGLAISSIAACGVFSAASGSSAATALAIGVIAVPEMLKRGYSKQLAAGAVAAGGTLGILIPPSGLFVLYGILTNTSIADLFVAGVIPGVIMVVLFSTYIFIRAARNPALAPRAIETFTWKERITSLKAVVGIAVIMVIVMGSLYSGIATASEVAAVGSFGALLVALFYRKLNWPNLRSTFLSTIRATCFILFIIIGAMIFAYLLTALEIPQKLTQAIVSMNMSPVMVIIAINVLLIFLGCFLDAAAMLVLTMPILFPLAVGLGYDPVWFGVMITLNMEIGNITPPVGLNLFVLRGITPAEVKTVDIYKGAAPFVGVLALGIALLIAFPSLALWLPGTAK